MTTTTLSKALLLASIVTLSACAPAATNGNGDSSSSAVAQSSSSERNALIEVTSPHANELVSSPLTITGEARGTWYFEASFPVQLLDANGKEIAVVPAEAQDNWMTEDFVPFVATLRFDTPATPTGTVVLHKDNPSGLPENEASISFPVRFR